MALETLTCKQYGNSCVGLFRETYGIGMSIQKSSTCWWNALQPCSHLLIPPLQDLQGGPLPVIHGGYTVLSYNPYQWPYKWVTKVVTPTSENYLTLLITGDRAHLVESKHPSPTAVYQSQMLHQTGMFTYIWLRSSSTKAPWYVNGIQFLMRCWLDAKVGKHVTQIVSTCWQSILRKNQSWVNFTHDVNRKHCKFTKFHQLLK